ncbi:hypothetical protein SLE2022_013360 [Rubroshorea leprosula]
MACVRQKNQGVGEDNFISSSMTSAKARFIAGFHFSLCSFASVSPFTPGFRFSPWPTLFLRSHLGFAPPCATAALGFKRLRN